MSFKESIKNGKPVFMIGKTGPAIATVVSCKITEIGIETVLEPIAPMTVEELEEGRINIMKALNHSE